MSKAKSQSKSELEYRGTPNQPIQRSFEGREAIDSFPPWRGGSEATLMETICYGHFPLLRRCRGAEL
ncbi:unnamed protein product [Litomosoides sigmodontis]|uniref:Uncharacterized protein n=1 Tax=Litomosoides sigmodontis TaxID=42156 RepID=A0A3P6SUC7_LITSI|nr:unnamed protein product [Litomosoides sigmodontis]